MMHKAWSGIEKTLYCFWTVSVKFQVHSGKKKNGDFDPNSTFADCDIGLNP